MGFKARLFFVSLLLLAAVVVLFACDDDSESADEFPSPDTEKNDSEYEEDYLPDDSNGVLVAGGATASEGMEAVTAADGAVFVVAQRSSQIVVFRIAPDKSIVQLVAPERGWSPHLALDASQRPHVMFFSPDASRIIVAAWRGEGWGTRSTASGVAYPSPAALAVDAQGYPHVALSGTQSGDGLTALRFDGDQWQREQIEAVEGAVTHVATRINDQGEEQILALAEDGLRSGYTNFRLHSLTNDGASWTWSSTEIGILDERIEAAFAWTGDGAAHFVGGSFIAKHVTNRGGQWRTSALEGIDSVAVSLAVDDAGDLLFGGRNAVTDVLVYGKYDGTWDLRPVSPQIDDVQYTAIAPGAPTIVYRTSGDLSFARRAGAVWESAVVDDAVLVTGFGEAGRPNVVLDEDGVTHIVFAARTNQGYKLVYTTDAWDGESEQLPGSELESMPMLAVGADAVVHLHVWHTYRFRDEDGWHLPGQSPPAVDDGAFCALAVDPDNRPVLGLYDYDTREVVSIVAEGSGWRSKSLLTLAEGFGDVYDGFRFRVDDTGSWHVAYVESSRVFHYAGAANDFVDETVWPDGVDRADGLDLTIDGEGNPHLLMNTSDALFEAERRDGVWRLTLIDARDYIEYPFVTSSADGALHVAYMLNRELWYATNAGGAPRRFLVATLTQGKNNPQIIVDNQGVVHVYALDSGGLWRFTLSL